MSAGRVSQTDSMQQESYRETISRRSESDFTHKKILDNGGEFARVVIQLEPLERGAGREFVNAMSNGAVPPDFIEGVQRARIHGFPRHAEPNFCSLLREFPSWFSYFGRPSS